MQYVQYVQKVRYVPHVEYVLYSMYSFYSMCSMYISYGMCCEYSLCSMYVLWYSMNSIYVCTYVPECTLPGTWYASICIRMYLLHSYAFICMRHAPVYTHTSPYTSIVHQNVNIQHTFSRGSQKVYRQ